MAQDLDLELKRLTVGTNDQRRRVGQALHHFYRTLVFWQDKGLSFLDVTRAWSAGGAVIFDSLASTLRELGGAEQDERLRAFVAEFLEHLAADLERGDHMVISFLRRLESLFPEVTAMMRAEGPDSRIYDVELADVLAGTFARTVRADRAAIVSALRETATDLRPGAGLGAPAGAFG